MKLLALFFVPLLLIPINVSAQSRSHSSKETKTAVPKKLEREILKAEASLGRAIVKRDATALGKLLTDYYAESFEGSERALNKQATLQRCKGGLLRFYGITSERTIRSSVDIVTIEGLTAKEEETKHGSEEVMHVKRLWTKKAGRWQLVAQTIGPADQD